MNYLILALALALAGLAATPAVAAEVLIYHDIQTDASGRIIPWAGPPAKAYDHIVRLVWNFWIKMRQCPNGVPYYMQHQVWKPDQDDKRGLGGDQINMALSSWTLLYGYLGDPAVRQNMIYMADYWLDHGMSKPSDVWASLPYPYNTELHSGQYDGDMMVGKGYLQPDKAASFGAELVVLWKMTQNQRYLDAAVKIANTLVKHVKPGDNDNSPWPYRVHAVTGEVRQVKSDDGGVYLASYTTNWTGALRLFEDLAALGKGDVANYRRTRQTLVAWLKTYPLKTNKWGPFFEDVGRWSDTEINADTLAWYILEHPEWDPNWREQAKSILGWSFKMFANQEWEKYGVVAINEQTAYKVPGNSHTSRYASVELLYTEKTGDLAGKEDAIRQLDWATYMVDDDGKNRYPRNDNWLTDGYGDYVRHYLRAMASFPELAPEDQNHLLRTSSVIRTIDYGPERITYEKSDARSTERFKLGAWPPGRVSGGEMRWDPKTKVLNLSSNKNRVTIWRAK